MRSFTPSTAPAVNITVGAASANARLVDVSSNQQVRVVNNGTAPVWIEFGGSTVAATAASGIVVPAGFGEVMTLPPEATHVAAIAAAATGIVQFKLGVGI